LSYIELVVLICLCLCGTVFFSFNRTALLIFSRVKLLEAFKSINKEKLTDKLVQNSEKLVVTCSLYRLICNVCVILLLLTIFSKIRGAGSEFVDFLITAIISIALFSVFSIAVPNAWAKYSGEKILCRTYNILMAFAFVAYPILRVFQFNDTLIRRLAGVAETTPEEQQEERQEEFLNGLEQRKMEGVVDEEEQEMIENVLELSDTAADEIITPRTDVVAIEVNTDLPEILKTISSAGHSRYPVYEENIDNIVGLIYSKDLLTEIGKDPANFELREKIRKAYFVPETKPLRELLREFQNQKLHIAIVLDEYGGTAGIVTLEDILEELVGEITDEYEETPAEHIKKIDADTIEVDARTYIDDLNDEFEFNLPEEEDYDTIGGFVFSHLGYIPKTAEIFEYENLKFTITAAEARKIKRIKIQKNRESENAQ